MPRPGSQEIFLALEAEGRQHSPKIIDPAEGNGYHHIEYNELGLMAISVENVFDEFIKDYLDKFKQDMTEFQ